VWYTVFVLPSRGDAVSPYSSYVARSERDEAVSDLRFPVRFSGLL
jgi:hypothetical protein